MSQLKNLALFFLCFPSFWMLFSAFHACYREAKPTTTMLTPAPWMMRRMRMMTCTSMATCWLMREKNGNSQTQKSRLKDRCQTLKVVRSYVALFQLQNDRLKRTSLYILSYSHLIFILHILWHFIYVTCTLPVHLVSNVSLDIPLVKYCICKVCFRQICELPFRWPNNKEWDQESGGKDVEM